MGTESSPADKVQQHASPEGGGMESEMGASMSPPAFALEASSVAQLQTDEGGADAAPVSAVPLTITRGELTATGEGSDAQTRYVHWPETSASGVTLGKGYDIGSRSAETVISELTAAGMSNEQATKISLGAGLTGQAAGTWVENNRDDVGEISSDVQTALLATMLVEYRDRARDMATNTEATKDGSGYYTNARGREIKDGVEEGTYRMSDEQWDNLHPAMVEFLTDLKYQGGYYAYDRIAQVNRLLIENDGNHLEQFKAVVALFEAAEGEDNSYMDNYGIGIGEGRGNTETFYDQSAEDLEGATTRRNRIRLAYLKQVIAALEAGQIVRMNDPDPNPEPVSGPR